jgi:N-acetylglutamate synthase/N-acetylornithine aminotransferase|tara:strand:+ start:270 stop:791 length:522 start_codon:yes stop_codon:yes gene_type:complete
MASQRLTDKSGLAQQTAKDDLLMVVDASDTTGSAQGTSKKIEAKNVIVVESISLSSAQIQALHTTPVQLIAAPGSGYAIQVHSILVNNTYVSTTETARRTGVIGYGTPAAFINEQFRIDSWMRNVTASNSQYTGPGFAFTTVSDNQPLKIVADLAITGDFTSVLNIGYTIIKL